MIDLTGATFRENCPSPLSQQLATANSVMAKGGILCPIPISILGLGQAEACTGPVYAVTTALSSHVQWSCVQKTLFPCSHSLPLALTLSTPLLQ